MAAVEIVSLLNTVLMMCRDVGIEYKDLARLFARADSEGRDITDEDLHVLAIKTQADLGKLADTIAAKRLPRPTIKVLP